MKRKHKLAWAAMLEWLSDKTNRSFGQTKFLFELLDRDFEKLKLLEMQIKNCLLYYCPSDKEEVERVMMMKQKCNLLEV